MLHVPDRSHLKRFNHLTWGLPPKLLPWLYARGLGIYVLPKDREDAKLFLSKNLRVKGKKLVGDGRKAVDTAHYRPDSRCIVLPNHVLLYSKGENVLHHELGHAIDFLYCENGNIFSRYSEVQKALQPDKPLNKYCRDKLKKHNNLLEQFATSFAAYFAEPSGMDDSTPTIDNLSPSMIKIIRDYLIKPFE